MKKKFWSGAYLAIAIFVFFTGLNRLHSVESFNDLGISRTLKCQDVFNGRCPDPGQCSYNLSHGTSACKIECLTKYRMNGVDKRVTTNAECKWNTSASNIPGDDDGNSPGTTIMTYFWDSNNWWR